MKTTKETPVTMRVTPLRSLLGRTHIPLSRRRNPSHIPLLAWPQRTTEDTEHLTCEFLVRAA